MEAGNQPSPASSPAPYVPDFMMSGSEAPASDALPFSEPQPPTFPPELRQMMSSTPGMLENPDLKINNTNETMVVKEPSQDIEETNPVDVPETTTPLPYVPHVNMEAEHSLNGQTFVPEEPTPEDDQDTPAEEAPSSVPSVTTNPEQTFPGSVVDRHDEQQSEQEYLDIARTETMGGLAQDETVVNEELQGEVVKGGEETDVTEKVTSTFSNAQPAEQMHDAKAHDKKLANEVPIDIEDEAEEGPTELTDHVTDHVTSKIDHVTSVQIDVVEKLTVTDETETQSVNDALQPDMPPAATNQTLTHLNKTSAEKSTDKIGLISSNVPHDPQNYSDPEILEDLAVGVSSNTSKVVEHVGNETLEHEAVDPTASVDDQQTEIMVTAASQTPVQSNNPIIDLHVNQTATDEDTKSKNYKSRQQQQQEHNETYLINVDDLPQPSDDMLMTQASLLLQEQVAENEEEEEEKAQLEDVAPVEDTADGETRQMEHQELEVDLDEELPQEGEVTTDGKEDTAKGMEENVDEEELQRSDEGKA